MFDKNSQPIPVVSVLIYNQKNQILLVKPPKYSDGWTLLGGKIKPKESPEEAVRREVREALGLDLTKIEFVSVNKHPSVDKNFIFLNFLAKESGGKLSKGSQVAEYKWFEPDLALKKEKLSNIASPLLRNFLDYLNNDYNLDFKNKYQRSLADYQNLIKQHEQDKKDFLKYALADFIQEILPVYDHLKLSLATLPDEEKNNAWVVGVKHVLRQFKELLTRRGLKEIITTGQKFDHNLMEAIEGEGDIVLKEISPGYTLNDRLLRPAKVVVAKEKLK